MRAAKVLKYGVKILIWAIQWDNRTKQKMLRMVTGCTSWCHSSQMIGLPHQWSCSRESRGTDSWQKRYLQEIPFGIMQQEVAKEGCKWNVGSWSRGAGQGQSHCGIIGQISAEKDPVIRAQSFWRQFGEMTTSMGDKESFSFSIFLLLLFTKQYKSIWRREEGTTKAQRILK